MDYSNYAALIPFYSECGENCTCIIYNDGKKDYLSSSLKKVIHEMFHSLYLDPCALKHWTSEMVGYKNNLPLLVDNTLIFLPIKLRKAVGKQDGCYGYFNIASILDYSNYLITLCNGEIIPTLSPKKYIQKKTMHANLLEYLYLEHKKQYEFMWQRSSSPLK